MTKKEWKDNYKVVITTEPIEIPLSECPSFLHSIADVADDFDISEQTMDWFIKAHLDDFNDRIRVNVKVEHNA